MGTCLARSGRIPKGKRCSVPTGKACLGVGLSGGEDGSWSWLGYNVRRSSACESGERRVKGGEMSGISFEQFFKSTEPDRDKFLSRLFGIFSERIVGCWCERPESEYGNLGRPTVRLQGEDRGRTLDFTFQSRCDGRVYVGELKCELEYENYRYIMLRSPSQLSHHTGESFRRFLGVAKNPSEYSVQVGGRECVVSGSILVWGSVSSDGRDSVMRETGLADVLSLEEIVTDLLSWGDADYHKFIGERARWCRELFAALGGHFA